MINDEFLHKWVNGTLSEKELNIFKARPEYESLSQLYKQTERLSAPDVDTEAMLQSIISNTAVKTDNSINKTIAKPTRRISLMLMLGAAASILLVSAIFLLKSDTTIENNTQTELAKSLPDGSEVILFANSKINYKESDWDTSRAIELEGKAFFKVQKGKPFTVNSEKGIVEVLGTQFIVDNKDKSFEVNCSEGKVSVKSNISDANTILVANESFSIYDEGGSILRKKELTKLKDVKLLQVLSEIEQVFGVTFQTDNIDLSQKLTSGFQHDNVDNAIKTFTMPLNMDYEKIGNQIRLILQ